MQKKIQDTDTTQHNSSVPPENRLMNKNMIRHRLFTAGGYFICLGINEL